MINYNCNFIYPRALQLLLTTSRRMQVQTQSHRDVRSRLQLARVLLQPLPLPQLVATRRNQRPRLSSPMMPQYAPSICLNTRCRTHGPSGIWRTIVPNRGRTCKTKSPASTQSRTFGVYTTTLSPHLRLSLEVTTRSSRRPFGKTVYPSLNAACLINLIPIVSPMWEDAANKQGGRWVITLNKNSKNDLDNLWLDVVSIQPAVWSIILY